MPSNGEHIPLFCKAKLLQQDCIETEIVVTIFISRFFFIRLCSSISMQSVIKVGFHSSPLLYCSVRAKKTFIAFAFLTLFFIFPTFFINKKRRKKFQL